MIKSFFNRGTKKNETAIVSKSFLDILEERMLRDKKLLFEVCDWLGKNSGFDKNVINENDLEIRTRACIGYLAIAIAAGEINEKELKNLVKKYERV